MKALPKPKKSLAAKIVPPSNTTERRRVLARDRIVEVAMERFKERGYDSVTVEEIADAANLSARSFFRYFSTKQEIVLVFEVKFRERFRKDLQHFLIDGTIDRALTDAIFANARAWEAQREDVALSASIISSSSRIGLAREFQSGWADVISSAISEVLGIKASMEVLLIAEIYAAAMRVAYKVWFTRGAKGSLVRLLKITMKIADEGGKPFLKQFARPSRRGKSDFRTNEAEGSALQSKRRKARQLVA